MKCVILSCREVRMSIHILYILHYMQLHIYVLLYITSIYYTYIHKYSINSITSRQPPQPPTGSSLRFGPYKSRNWRYDQSPTAPSPQCRYNPLDSIYPHHLRLPLPLLYRCQTSGWYHQWKDTHSSTVYHLHMPRWSSVGRRRDRTQPNRYHRLRCWWQKRGGGLC